MKTLKTMQIRRVGQHISFDVSIATFTELRSLGQFDANEIGIPNSAVRQHRGHGLKHRLVLAGGIRAQSSGRIK